ncbi:hypothetical protein [Aureivirga marina]|uniref:hypothetical protein n=1 Tax=Aureivirga marina TaxID=1182451 RepID=UPI0018CAB162|nr:hypothetical protein [Aureivirga marina]
MKKDDKHNDFLNREKDLYQKNGFSTPDAYFESFEDDLMSKILEEEIKEKSSTKTGMKVPDLYFDSLEEKIFENLPKEEKKSKIRFLNTSNFYRFASVAAAAILIIWIMTTKKEQNSLNFDSISNNELNNWVTNETGDLGTYELAALYEDNEDLLGQDILFTNTISDEDLELYLNDIEIEDLLDSEN